MLTDLLIMREAFQHAWLRQTFCCTHGHEVCHRENNVINMPMIQTSYREKAESKKGSDLSPRTSCAISISMK